MAPSQFNSLPEIDLASLDSAATLRDLDEACRHWGAFRLRGAKTLLDSASALWPLARDFFELPQARKEECQRSASNPWGYFAEELTLNTIDCKEIYDYGPDSGPDMRAQWPQIAGFQATVSSHYAECENVGWQLLAAITSNLGVNGSQTAASFQPAHTSFLRLNYYPLCERPRYPEGAGPAGDRELGVNPHTDAGALTVLVQDENAGLEFYLDGRWQRVPGDCVLVNLGDVFQVWSNDTYRAPLHRVVGSVETPRLSAPWFFNPAYEADYAPLGAKFGAPRYRSINWGEFRRLRAAGDYADLGQEVQISDYRIEL